MSSKRKILITGVSGLLGNNLARALVPFYRVVGLFNTNAVRIEGVQARKGDITDESGILRILKEEAPDCVIHCASLTNVDDCEIHPEFTKQVNTNGTKYVCDGAQSLGAKIVYISSDAVYDGTSGNYSETDPVSPRNVYGKTKLDGEGVVAELQHSLILRTNIFGINILNKFSLAEWFLDALRSGREVSGFSDAIFSTIYTFELARVIQIAIQKNLCGLYNCGSRDSCSKFEFGRRIASVYGLDDRLVRPLSIKEAGLRAERGHDLSVNVARLEADLDYRLPTIDRSIDSFYRDSQAGLPDFIQKWSTPVSRPPKLLQYGRQWIDQEDIDVVVETLRSSRITQGPVIPEFERALSRVANADYAVAVNSGTSALHIACLAAGIGSGDEVITSPITFVASANCGAYCGATPVFADIDPLTYNISPEAIREKITERTRGIIPVHFAGQSCDMAAIRKIVEVAEATYNHKIHIIEDSSHALGSAYRGEPVGCCRYSDMATTSFHPVKHVTTGEGGAVFTKDETLYNRLRRFRSHGITNTPTELVDKQQAFRDARESNPSAMNPWYYEQQELGYNYRITDLQCALGLSQLSKLDFFRERRRRIVDRYNTAFSGVSNIQTPFESEDCYSNFHLYVLLIDFKRIGKPRHIVMKELKEGDIQTQVHYIPVHTQPFYRTYFNTRWGECPNAEAYYNRCLTIPLFPEMEIEDADRVVNQLSNLINHNTRK